MKARGRAFPQGGGKFVTNQNVRGRTLFGGQGNCHGGNEPANGTFPTDGISEKINILQPPTTRILYTRELA